MIYIPPPPKTPLILRPARWSGGLPVALLLAVALLAVPAIYGAAILAAEVSALLEPGGTAR